MYTKKLLLILVIEMRDYLIVQYDLLCPQNINRNEHPQEFKMKNLRRHKSLK